MNLITIDDLAAMLKLSRSHVRDVVVKQREFPKPVTGIRKPRWDESAVVRYFKSVQKANIQPQSQ
jgi:predicted DNA-binding transcriptional regulator AlpA